MARMKFLCDAERCIECNGCVTACKQEHDIPWGVNRRRVVTINDGVPGERSISVACMHCSDAPCSAVCPVDCFYTGGGGVGLGHRVRASGCATRRRTAWRNSGASESADAAEPGRRAEDMMRNVIAPLIVLGAAAVALYGCGERPQVVQYKQGQYQGK